MPSVHSPPSLDILSRWLTDAQQPNFKEFNAYTTWRQENVPVYTEQEYDDISSQLIQKPALTQLQWCSWLIHGVKWPPYYDVNKIIKIEPYVKTWIEHSNARQWPVDELEELARKYVEAKWPQMSELKNLWILEDIYMEHKAPHDGKRLNTYLTRIAAIQNLDDTYENLKYKGESMVGCFSIEDILNSTEYSNDLKWSAWMAFSRRGFIKESLDKKVLGVSHNTVQLKLNTIFNGVKQEYKEWWKEEGLRTWYIQHNLWDNDPFSLPGHPLVMLWSEHRDQLKILHALDTHILRDGARIKAYLNQTPLPSFDSKDISFD